MSGIGLDEMIEAIDRASALVNQHPSWERSAAVLGIDPSTFAMLRDYAGMVGTWEWMTPEKMFGMGILIGVIAGRQAGLRMERR